MEITLEKPTKMIIRNNRTLEVFSLSALLCLFIVLICLSVSSNFSNISTLLIGALGVVTGLILVDRENKKHYLVVLDKESGEGSFNIGVIKKINIRCQISEIKKVSLRKFKMPRVFGNILYSNIIIYLTENREIKLYISRSFNLSATYEKEELTRVEEIANFIGVKVGEY